MDGLPCVQNMPCVGKQEGIDGDLKGSGDDSQTGGGTELSCLVETQGCPGSAGGRGQVVGLK